MDQHEFDRLPDSAFVRLYTLMKWGLLPFSASTLWRKCQNGQFPKPIKISPGITAWRVGDIRKYLQSLSNSSKDGAA